MPLYVRLFIKVKFKHIQASPRSIRIFSCIFGFAPHIRGEELVLGPFQGPVACTRIRLGKGVCGAAWKQAKTILIPDVNQFPGHIACSSDSKSEIAVPAFKDGKVALILDVDSDKHNDFDAVDKQYLKQLMKIVEGLL